jgi:hypothetical protein
MWMRWLVNALAAKSRLYFHRYACSASRACEQTRCVSVCDAAAVSVCVCVCVCVCVSVMSHLDASVPLDHRVTQGPMIGMRTRPAFEDLPAMIESFVQRTCACVGRVSMACGVGG